MCGIAGIHTPGKRVDTAVVAAMLAQMHHRGPDGEGSFVEDDIGLGMRRLAIVDVEGGRQPLANEDGSIKVVFNGEIYNHAELRRDLAPRGHRFASDSDGEVIPHLYEQYGPDFVERLDGIFAFALWDARTRTLMLARDQLGVKPLYLHAADGDIRFASELKALLADPAVPRRLDEMALDEYLTFRFTPAPHTLLAGVEKLEPATYALVRDGRQTRRRYWDPTPSERDDISLREAAEEFARLLRAAVQRQMMSDRPIGAMLSGGIDSAAVVAMMSEASSKVKTFTVGFEGGGDADETGLARETARLFDTEHHDRIVPLADFRHELAGVIDVLEEPVGTSSALGFREVSRLARPLVPVLLSGQGADELLAGYWRYVGEWMAGRTLGVVNRLGLTRPVGSLARRVRTPRLERGLRALQHPDTLTRFINIYAVFNDAQKHELYGPAFRQLAPHNGAGPARHVERYRSRAAERDSLSQMMFVDTRLWLPDDLLLVGDKTSMSESVEMRVPFLDRTLVEFVESLPARYKLRRGTRKVVEKEALSSLLPSSIVHRKERGFITPVDRWLREGLHDEAREILLDPGGVCGQLMNRDYVDRLLAQHRDGSADNTRQIFLLFSLELWNRSFVASQAAASTPGPSDQRRLA
jgi:asparagine synthase (glutamine-hydrolysing)